LQDFDRNSPIAGADGFSGLTVFRLFAAVAMREFWFWFWNRNAWNR